MSVHYISRSILKCLFLGALATECNCGGKAIAPGTPLQPTSGPRTVTRNNTSSTTSRMRTTIHQTGDKAEDAKMYSKEYLSYELPTEEITTPYLAVTQAKAAILKYLEEVCGKSFEGIDFYHFDVPEAEKWEKLLPAGLKKIDITKCPRIVELYKHIEKFEPKEGAKNPLFSDNFEAEFGANSLPSEKAMQEVGKIQERLSDPSFILNLTEEKIKSIEQGEVMGKMTFYRIFKDLKQIPIEMLSTFLFTSGVNIRQQQKDLRQGKPA